MRVIRAAVALLAFSVCSLQASLRCQLRVLDLTANGGINPATAAPWKAGDRYRLVFVTSATTTSDSTTIATYNTFVQNAADNSTRFPSLATVRWKATCSTGSVNANTNTGTGSGIGEAIFLMNGSTSIANNYADLWDGTIAANITRDENNAIRAVTSVWTGTIGNGAKDGRPNGALGTGSPTTGVFNSTPNKWADSGIRAANGIGYPMYALSEPLTNVVDILDNFAAQYPAWKDQGFEIAGYVWWQGHRDQGNTVNSNRYRQNMERFIKQIRLYYENRYGGGGEDLTRVKSNAPFVLATLDAGGWSMSGDALTVANAQHAVDGNAKTSGVTNYPEFTGNTYANWIASYPSVPPGLAGSSQDSDGDGIDNGAENFFGSNPSVGSSGMVAGASGVNTFSFTNPQNATPATGVTAAYRWSKDLVTFRNHGQSDGTTTVNFSTVTNEGITTVTATVVGAATKLFVDVKVTQN